MDWISVKKQKPICWETGDWDGKRSDLVLCIDKKGEKYLAKCYEGTMDGSHFFEWYDKNDFELQVEITRWCASDDLQVEINIKSKLNEIGFNELGSGWYKNKHDTIRLRFWKDNEIDFWLWRGNDDNQIHFRGKIYTIDDVKWVLERCF